MIFFENALCVMLLWVMGNKWWVLYRNNASQTVEQGKRDYLEQLSLKLGSLYRTDILFSWLDQHLITAAFIFEATHDYFKEKISNMLEAQQSRFLQNFVIDSDPLESLKVIISSRKKIEFYKILLYLFLV